MKLLKVKKTGVLLAATLAMVFGLFAATNAAEDKINTIAEIYANKAALKGKIVKVHGKVTKVNTQIMGNTWVHLDDGTGKGEQADFVFKSKTESAEVGQTVTAQGTLNVDVDFGSGYFFPVIAEDSKFTK